MNKIFFAAFFITLCCIACKKEVPEVNLYGFTNYKDAEKALGKYAQALYVVDGSIYTRADEFEANAFSSGKTLVYTSAWFSAGHGLGRADGGNFFIDDFEMDFDEVSGYTMKNIAVGTTDDELSAKLAKMYGKTVNAKLVKNDKIIFQTSYYTPKLLNAVVPAPKKTDMSLNPVTTKDGITVKWDKDESNKNGVLFHVIWTGDQLNAPLEKQGTAGFKDFALKVDDTGQFTIPRSFFDRLPKDAIFTLNAIRGNIEIIEGTDKKQYKVYNFNESKMNCFLN